AAMRIGITVQRYAEGGPERGPLRRPAPALRRGASYQCVAGRRSQRSATTVASSSRPRRPRTWVGPPVVASLAGTAVGTAGLAGVPTAKSEVDAGWTASTVAPCA